MRICENGIYRDMTPEEIAALEAQRTEVPEPSPTIEERLARVEEDSGVIRAILLGEASAK